MILQELQISKIAYLERKECRQKHQDSYLRAFILCVHMNVTTISAHS